MEPQHQQLIEEEAKLGQTLQSLQSPGQPVPDPEGDAQGAVHRGPGGDLGQRGGGRDLEVDQRLGCAVQRAQDKIAGMQARSGALDELLESGVLEDVGGGRDDIQHELDKVGARARWSRAGRPQGQHGPRGRDRSRQPGAAGVHWSRRGQPDRRLRRPFMTDLGDLGGSGDDSLDLELAAATILGDSRDVQPC